MKLRKIFFSVLLLTLTLTLSGCGEVVLYDQSGYTPGTTENCTYNSPLADLSCTVSGEWLIYGPENYEAVIGLKQDLENRQQIEDILNAGQSVYEFYAAHADRTILRVSVEDLRVRYDDDITAQDYAESQAAYLPSWPMPMPLKTSPCSWALRKWRGRPILLSTSPQNWCTCLTMSCMSTSSAAITSSPSLAAVSKWIAAVS